jgi:hypothetical protein
MMQDSEDRRSQTGTPGRKVDFIKFIEVRYSKKKRSHNRNVSEMVSRITDKLTLSETIGNSF